MYKRLENTGNEYKGQDVTIKESEGSNMSVLSDQNSSVYNNAIEQTNLVVSIISLIDGFWVSVDPEKLALYRWYSIDIKEVVNHAVHCVFDSMAWVGIPKENTYEQLDCRRTE